MIDRGITTDTLRDLAQQHGVCIRPVVHEVADTVTGQLHLVSTPCGATLASKCEPCAHRNRVLRMQQCREGWHLQDEPERRPTEDPADDPADDTEDPEDTEAAIEEPSDAGDRRVRSTRRRQDAPDLPRVPMDHRTIGQTFTTPSGRTYRPSMFVTFTLPSYGRVRDDGTPVAPARYHYRRAALDALHFPKLIDRVWQNLRRCTGYQVQYFAVIEAQRRLAPHLHTALRGAIPRELLRQVAAATYQHVWWPPFDVVRYPQHALPLWDGTDFVDPTTGNPLPTWAQALDSLDQQGDAASPAHTLRLGKQIDIQGVVADEDDADRRVAYLTKYLGKSLSEPTTPGTHLTRRQRSHVDRLLAELRWLPCSPRCWNWLRYGVQPDGATPEALPGSCPGKAHDEQHLGCGGRRVLVSRRWTGKTLTDHRADRADVVRQTLEAAGIDSVELDRLAADTKRPDGRPRYEWRLWNAHEAPVPVYRIVLTRAIAERIRWQADYQSAKAQLGLATTAPSTGPPASS
ncbi:replication initiator [Nocardioides bruguierae]|uniref:Replication initiation protein n=1 Tax=Nocardioides bruguierae TaxID=2945102 RepID=A0A9X2DBS0_9ACTN|nr:replication initiator [Nocardioides bruguierae]MCM0622457.1 replication initiation protein [Nocardioides bruguierae]